MDVEENNDVLIQGNFKLDSNVKAIFIDQNIKITSLTKCADEYIYNIPHIL